MTEIKPGWWRMRNGCVALVVDVNKSLSFGVYGYKYSTRITCNSFPLESPTFNNWTHNGSHSGGDADPHDLVSYLGSHPPTDWYVEPVKEKTWRPWDWYAMVSHQNAWFSFVSHECDIWYRVEAISDKGKQFRIGSSWVTSDYLFVNYRWRMLPGDEPQRCGVEE